MDISRQDLSEIFLGRFYPMVDKWQRVLLDQWQGRLREIYPDEVYTGKSENDRRASEMVLLFESYYSIILFLVCWHSASEVSSWSASSSALGRT